MSSLGVSQSGMRGCLPATSAPVPNLTHFQNRCLFRHRAPSTRHGATQSGRDLLVISNLQQYPSGRHELVVTGLSRVAHCKVHCVHSRVSIRLANLSKYPPSPPDHQAQLPIPSELSVTGWPTLEPSRAVQCPGPARLQGNGAAKPASYEASIPPVEAVVRSVPSCTCMPWYAVSGAYVCFPTNSRESCSSFPAGWAMTSGDRGAGG